MKSNIQIKLQSPNIISKQLILKWYYDENRIFPIEAILKHKQVLCSEKKNAFTFFQISLFIPEIFKFLKYAN